MSQLKNTIFQSERSKLLLDNVLAYENLIQLLEETHQKIYLYEYYKRPFSRKENLQTQLTQSEKIFNLNLELMVNFNFHKLKIIWDILLAYWTEC